MNAIAKESSDYHDEEYMIKYQKDKNVKYIQICCKAHHCKFRLWFKYDGDISNPKNIAFARKIYISHDMREHKQK